MGNMLTDEEGRFTFIMEPFTGRHNLSLNLTNEKKKLIDGRILLHRHFSPQPRVYHFMEKDILSTPQPLQPSMDAFSFTGANLLSGVQVGRNRRQFEPFTLHNIKEEREKALDTGDWIFTKISIEAYIEDKYLLSEEEILWSFKVSSTKEEQGQEFISRKDFGGRRIKDFELEHVDYIQVYKNLTSHERTDWAEPLSIGLLNKRYKHISNWIYRKPKPIKGLRTTHIDGYSEVIDYYHPQYNREIIPGEVDYRRTLYWNPCMELNKEGKTNVTFYNNGTCRKPIINVNIFNQ